MTQLEEEEEDKNVCYGFLQGVTRGSVFRPAVAWSPEAEMVREISGASGQVSREISGSHPRPSASQRIEHRRHDANGDAWGSYRSVPSSAEEPADSHPAERGVFHEGDPHLYVVDGNGNHAWWAMGGRSSSSRDGSDSSREIRLSGRRSTHPGKGGWEKEDVGIIEHHLGDLREDGRVWNEEKEEPKEDEDEDEEEEEEECKCGAETKNGGVQVGAREPRVLFGYFLQTRIHVSWVTREAQARVVKGPLIRTGA